MEKIKMGVVDIWFPRSSNAQFEIFEDLATLFNVKYQSDAIDLLKLEMRHYSEIKPKPSIDYEADYTHILTRSANTIITMASIINDLSNPNSSTITTYEGREEIIRKIKSFKRPKKKKWSIGDVFSFKLENNSFMFGQVISTYLVKSPVCILFELNAQKEDITNEQLECSRVLSLVNTDGEYLDDGKFHILFNRDILLSKYHNDTSRSTGDAVLVLLGNAYYGLHPWNVYYSDYYFDTMLLDGILRPKSIKILDEKARDDYRLKYFGIDSNNKRISK